MTGGAASSGRKNSEKPIQQDAGGTGILCFFGSKRGLNVTAFLGKARYSL